MGIETLIPQDQDAPLNLKKSIDHWWDHWGGPHGSDLSTTLYDLSEAKTMQIQSGRTRIMSAKPSPTDNQKEGSIADKSLP
jgi:hypothetical protein